MVHFDRESLIKMQEQAYIYRCKDIYAWLIIANVALFIVAGMLFYFVSYGYGLLVEGLTLAVSAYYYASLSLKKSKVSKGKYLTYSEISVIIEETNLVFFLKDNESERVGKMSKLTVPFDSVKKVKRVEKVVYIAIARGGSIKLPYIPSNSDFYAKIKDIFAGRYQEYDK